MIHTALLIVDVQNDFCPGGALAVPDGDKVVAPLSRLARGFRAAGQPVFASRDWHPEKTVHFKEGGGIWPPHCVQGTEGANFHPELVLPEGTVVISKGTGENEDAYSAFEARDSSGRLLAELLRQGVISHLVVGGLATDYCVKATVLDALKEGFSVTLLEDAIAGVDLKEGDAAEAIAAMQEQGAEVKSSTAVLL